MQSIDIVVKLAAGAYVTNAVGGKRSSATAGPEAAANLQAIKLFADRVLRVEQISRADTKTMNTTVWRAYASTDEAI